MSEEVWERTHRHLTTTGGFTDAGPRLCADSLATGSSDESPRPPRQLHRSARAGHHAALARLEAWGQGDSETVLRSLDPAVEIHSPPDVGNAGTYRVGGYREWEGLWMEAWEDYQNEILRVEPVGQRHLVVDAHERGTGRGSGVEVDKEVSMLREIRDGRMVRFHISSTHERALAVARHGDSSG